MIVNAVRAALGAPAAPTVRAIQERIQTAAEELEPSVDAASLRRILATSHPPTSSTEANEAFWESLNEDGMAFASGVKPPSRMVLAAALDELMELQEMDNLHGGTGPHTASLVRPLEDAESATAIELLLEGLKPADWRVVKAIREVIALQVWRQPVGERLN